MLLMPRGQRSTSSRRCNWTLDTSRQWNIWLHCIFGGEIQPVTCGISGYGATMHGTGMRVLRNTILSIGTLTTLAVSLITRRLLCSFAPHQDGAILPTRIPVGPFAPRLDRYWTIALRAFCAR